MIKRTPGLWIVKETESGAEIVALNNGAQIAGCIENSGKGTGNWYHVSLEEARFNAQTMSAAPELLEYAKMEGEIDELREEIHRDEKRPHSNHGEILEKYQRLDNMVDAAQTLRLSAIRKAEEE
jgi:hypothetical protein